MLFRQVSVAPCAWVIIIPLLLSNAVPAKTAVQLSSELADILPPGRKARLAWLQGCCHDKRWYPDSSHEKTIYVFDSDDGLIRELTPASIFPAGKRSVSQSGIDFTDGNPCITFDGSRVIFFENYTGAVYWVSWNGSGGVHAVDMPAGWYASRYWRDRVNGSDWIIAQDGSRIWRVNIDNPANPVLLWNLTGNTRPWYTLSADGTRLAINIHPNIGIATVPNGTMTIVDTAGCWPSIAPDNSYRVLLQTPYHTYWRIRDAAGRLLREVNVNDSILSWATANSAYNWCDGLREHAWTRWSSDTDYVTFYMNCTNVNPFIARLSDGKWMYIVDSLGPCNWAGNMDMVVLDKGQSVAAGRPLQSPARDACGWYETFAIDGRHLGAGPTKTSLPAPGVMIQAARGRHAIRVVASPPVGRASHSTGR